MKMKRSGQASVLVLVVAALFSQNLVIPVMSSVINFQDQKTYYSPDPHAKTPPTGGHTTPTVPSHGRAPPANCGNNPPSGGHHSNTPTPPKGGGGFSHMS